MPSGIINICLGRPSLRLYSYSRGPSAARANYGQLRLFKRPGEREHVPSADNDQSLLSALQNRATAYSPPSIAVLPPPPRPQEPRCRLLPALRSRAAASSPPSRAALPPPRALSTVALPPPTPRPPESRCHLLPALRSRAAASSPPSTVALPPPPRPQEPRCRLLPALQSRAATSPRTLHSRAAASNSPPSRVALPPPPCPQKSRCGLQLPSLQSRARCRRLSTLPSPLSGAHDTPSPLPHKVHNVIQFYKRLLERTMSPNRLIVILFHASPPLSPINSHASLLSPPPLSPWPPTANDCRHLTSLPRAHPLQMTATASSLPLSQTCDYCCIASLLSAHC